MAIVSLCAAGLLVACGGGAGEASDTTSRPEPAATDGTETDEPTTAAAPAGGGAVDRDDPCTLLTASEASDLAGINFSTGQTQPFESGTACTYINGGNIVGIQVFSAPGTEDLLAASAPQFAPDAVPIDDIGEAAFISDAEASIGVLQDGLIFTITIALDSQPAPRATVLASAGLVLDRIA